MPYPLTSHVENERDPQRRLYVNEHLPLPAHPDIYTADDTAHAKTETTGNTALMTCQHAIQLGKSAGHNAAEAC